MMCKEKTGRPPRPSPGKKKAFPIRKEGRAKKGGPTLLKNPGTKMKWGIPRGERNSLPKEKASSKRGKKRKKNNITAQREKKREYLADHQTP